MLETDTWPTSKTSCRHGADSPADTDQSGNARLGTPFAGLNPSAGLNKPEKISRPIHGKELARRLGPKEMYSPPQAVFFFGKNMVGASAEKRNRAKAF